MYESRDRVTRGAALLDRHYPGWEHRVNVARLEQLAYDRCVLAQIAGNGESYGRGKQNLGALAGFATGWDGGYYGFDGAGDSDNDWWRQEIHSRLNAPRTVEVEDEHEEAHFEGVLTVGGKEIKIPHLPMTLVIALVDANR